MAFLEVAVENQNLAEAQTERNSRKHAAQGGKNEGRWYLVREGAEGAKSLV
jgi:hypothetical protein